MSINNFRKKKSLVIYLFFVDFSKNAAYNLLLTKMSKISIQSYKSLQQAWKITTYHFVNL